MKTITTTTQRERIPLVEWACAYSAWSNSTNTMCCLCIVIVIVFVIAAVWLGLYLQLYSIMRNLHVNFFLVPSYQEWIKPCLSQIFINKYFFKSNGHYSVLIYFIILVHFFMTNHLEIFTGLLFYAYGL